MEHQAPSRYDQLPGWELVSKGIEDVAVGRSSIEAALVFTATERLRGLGLTIPAPSRGQGSDLYALVEAQVGHGRAHGRYNALRRRLSSFLDAASRAPTG